MRSSQPLPEEHRLNRSLAGQSFGRWRLFGCLIVCFAMAGCGSAPKPAPKVASSAPKPHAKTGKPYVINGVRYYPADDRGYDQVGMASWYGPGFHGKTTANGERYNMNALTAAHKTLPMPSFVRVTSLDNGRSLVLRINDRGPFVDGRIIDVSRRAAQLLGFKNQGIKRVRVTRVDANGRPFRRQKREQAPRQLMASTDNPRIVATSSRGRASVPARPGAVFVQVGAFSEWERAAQQGSAVADLGPVTLAPVMASSGSIYRVRIGPFTESRLAQNILRQVHKRGFREAKLFAAKTS